MPILLSNASKEFGLTQDFISNSLIDVQYTVFQVRPSMFQQFTEFSYKKYNLESQKNLHWRCGPNINNLREPYLLNIGFSTCLCLLSLLLVGNLLTFVVEHCVLILFTRGLTCSKLFTFQIIYFFLVFNCKTLKYYNLNLSQSKQIF